MSVETRIIAVTSITLILLGVIVILVFQPSTKPSFDGQRALADVEYQIALGPRVSGSIAHVQSVAWMVQSLRASGWQVGIQDNQSMGHPVRNIIAKRGIGQPWIIIGAHYDSRMLADQDTDPEGKTKPVPGANDGASGVAVLMELARVLPRNLDKQVWLLFFY